MKTQKIVNLLNSSENEYSKLATENGTLLIVKRRGIFASQSNKVFNKTNKIKSLSLF